MVSAPLNSVNLLKNDIGEAAADVVRAAEQHGKIQTLCGIKPGQKKADFSSKYLKTADAVLLAYDIKVNNLLTALNIGDNWLGVEGAKAIAGALPSTQLTTLDIRSISIGVEGAKAIAGVLPR